jgi:propanediol utilization protein
MKGLGAIDWRGSERCTVLLVESSNRHIHLSAEDLVRLFGEGHEMVAMGALAGIPKDLAMLTGFASTDVYV